jgi:polysaccharide biosynthesis protein PslH
VPGVVFTGAMDYWPNIDAVSWFADRIFPAIRAAVPAAQFTIVGSRPTEAVLALARQPGVIVTGSVPDVRPWLAHAACAVAPLRIARGVQNKVLEAMAMARPGRRQRPGRRRHPRRSRARLHPGAGRSRFRPAVIAQLQIRRANAAPARDCILENYDWDRNLRAIDPCSNRRTSGRPPVLETCPA